MDRVVITEKALTMLEEFKKFDCQQVRQVYIEKPKKIKIVENLNLSRKEKQILIIN